MSFFNSTTNKILFPIISALAILGLLLSPSCSKKDIAKPPISKEIPTKPPQKPDLPKKVEPKPPNSDDGTYWNGIVHKNKQGEWVINEPTGPVLLYPKDKNGKIISKKAPNVPKPSHPGSNGLPKEPPIRQITGVKGKSHPMKGHLENKGQILPADLAKPWKSYTKELKVRLLKEKRPFFVHFTGDFCIICKKDWAKVDKKKLEKFAKEHNIVLLTGDITKDSKFIGKELEKLKLGGVPGYLFVDGKGKPHVRTDGLKNEKDIIGMMK